MHHESPAVKTVLLLAIRAYRFLLSPWLGRACRFVPTCSEYAQEAIERHGAVDGSILAAWRVARCNPWGGAGLDQVPAQGPVRALLSNGVGRTRKGLACHCVAHSAGRPESAPSNHPERPFEPRP
jgi:uncharacterized protein